MPSKTFKQLKYIYAMRKKYKNKKNAPKNMKWLFDDEWLKLENHKIKSFNEFLLK